MDCEIKINFETASYLLLLIKDKTLELILGNFEIIEEFLSEKYHKRPDELRQVNSDVPFVELQIQLLGLVV